MIDLEEIESQYKAEVEKEDREYKKRLNDSANKDKKKQLEKDYRSKLRKLLEKYNKNVTSSLDKKDVKLFEERESFNEERDEKKQPNKFKVVEFDLNPGYKEKSKVWWDVFKFNSGVKYRNFVHRFVPTRIILSFLTFKFEFISAYIDLKSFFLSVWRVIFNKTRFFVKEIKFVSIEFFETSKKFFNKSREKIPFFKKKIEGKDKKEGVKTGEESEKAEEVKK